MVVNLEDMVKHDREGSYKRLLELPRYSRTTRRCASTSTRR